MGTAGRLAVVLSLALAWSAAPLRADAAFGDVVRAGATASAATVAPPSGLHCEGIHLLSLTLRWTPSQDAASQVLTTPTGATVPLAADVTTFPVATVAVGTYSVRTVHPSGWTSAPAADAVTAVGGVAVCAS